KPLRPDPAAFQTAQALARRARKATEERQRAWEAATQALRNDPSLLIYYPFESREVGSRTLLDQSGARRKPPDGALGGCSGGPGRWPGKGGLEFKRVSDRVRLHIPGTFDSLTFVAWVRVDALPNRNNSLLMADGWEEGTPHWQIGTDGTLILGVQGHGET